MRTNEKRTVINEYDDINVRVDYFWITKDNKRTNWNDQTELPVGWLHAKVRVDLLEFTETFENLGKTMDIAVCQLYINEEFIGELIAADLKETDNGIILKCAVAVGRG